MHNFWSIMYLIRITGMPRFRSQFIAVLNDSLF